MIIPPDHTTVYVGWERREMLLIGIAADGKHGICRGVPLVDGTEPELVPWPDVFWNPHGPPVLQPDRDQQQQLIDELEHKLSLVKSLSNYMEEAVLLLRPGDDEDYKECAARVIAENDRLKAEVDALERANHILHGVCNRHAERNVMLEHQLVEAFRRSWIDHIRAAAGALLQRIRGARR